MKTIKNFIIVMISALSIQTASAQSSPMKEPISFKLKNGLTVIVAQNENSNKIYAGFTADEEPYESIKPGARDVFNSMMNFSDKGGNINANTLDFNNALTLFSKTVKEPVLNQDAFETAIAKVIASVNDKDQYYPETVTETSLKALTLADIKAYYSRNIKPSNTYLTIAGDITVAEAKSLTKKSFGDWTSPASKSLASK
ncbi:pitrilysin family protein [Pedobacter sp. V48]|uniref:M16 family metallopeptidase n=1 Tax=Pedobacter sp. V48 TaxID=509635 RepID=UPI0003E45BE2|nr:insulinase family protein [Pedobacter sp. V48]ETZ23873.1 hypothetical protein N824_15155 [Pedobacter sp. V48]